MRLIDFFDRGASLGRDRVCLRDERRMLTYGDVQVRTFRIARALSEAGLARSSIAAVLSHNDIEAFTCILGILRAGVVWMPLNARSTPNEIIDHLRRFRCEWLFYHSVFGRELVDISSAVPSLKGTICIDTEDEMGRTLATWWSQDAKPFESEWEFNDVGCLMLTGGTTGRSKGIMLTHRNLSIMVANTITAMPYADAPRYLMAAPMTHAAGCFGLSFLPFGSENFFLPRADPKLVLEALEGWRITTVFLPPTVIYMMLAQPDVHSRDYSALRHLIYGAAPIAEDKLTEAIRVFGPALAEIYGQSESPAPCAFMSPAEHAEILANGGGDRLMSCGRPTIFTGLAILDDDGRPVAMGERGEIAIRGDHVMKGYFEDMEATREVSKHGWHLTGDVGYQDSDGYLYIVDRKKEMIISGGFNIFPREVEQIILKHPAIQECAVVGIPDGKWGEAVFAILELKAGAEIDLAEMAAFCRSRLGGVKSPKAFEVWNEIPRSPVGKISRRMIRDLYWKNHEKKI